MSAINQTKKAAEFLKLHKGPRPLLLVNVWDVASARIVEEAGFPALATSSAAMANSLGYPDGERIPRDEMIAAVQRIASKVSIPVSADLEAGYGDVRGTARALVEAGAVGLNFEDGTHDAKDPLAPVEDRARGVKQIREAGDALGVHIVINARTDVFLAQVGEPASRFDHAVRRANTYREAGADCMFVPGVTDSETIARLVRAIRGPINILATPASPPLAELERLGVRRVSLGSWPMRATMGFLQGFTRDASQKGNFSGLEVGIPYQEMNELMD